MPSNPDPDPKKKPPAKKPAPPAAPVPVPVPTTPPPAEEEEEKDDLDAMSVAELAEYVRANPFAHLTHANIRRLFNFGQKTMRKIADMKPPSVSRKINPDLFRKWLWMNRAAVEKLTA